MVQTVQTTDEYYSTDGLPVDFSANSSYDDDEQFVILMCLALLKKYYELYHNQSPEEVLKRITKDMESFNKDLSDDARKYVQKAVDEYFEGKLNEHNIPSSVVAPDYNNTVIIAGITALVNQLHDDLKAKAIFYKNNLVGSSFDVKPNFERAVKRINDIVGTGLIHAKEKSNRNISKFMYGDNALYRWVCKLDAKTCSWCRSQARSTPRKIDEWELDHPFGRCVLVPVSDELSEDYKLLIGV